MGLLYLNPFVAGMDRKRGNYKSDPERDVKMRAAVAACNGGMTITEAARHYGVPRTTLSDR